MKQNNFSVLQTKKLQHFCYWSIIVILVFYGYHILPQGICIINQIKSYILKFTLASNSKFNLCIKEPDKLTHVNTKVLDLFYLPTPYVIKGVNRYSRDTNKLVSDKLGLIATDQLANKRR